MASLDLQRWIEATSDPTQLLLDKATTWNTFAEHITSCVCNSYVSLSSLFDLVDIKPQKWELITDQQAKCLTEVLNSQCQYQFSFVISASEYQDPQRIKDSIKERCNKTHERLHFVFRVEERSENGVTRFVVSEGGQNWGYLSFSSDMTSIQYGSLHGDQLPSNLLEFFLPVFQEVVQLNGTQMTKYPPRPSLVQLQRHTKQNDREGTLECYKLWQMPLLFLVSLLGNSSLNLGNNYILLGY